jgi:hypothetical protein
MARFWKTMVYFYHHSLNAETHKGMLVKKFIGIWVVLYFGFVFVFCFSFLSSMSQLKAFIWGLQAQNTYVVVPSFRAVRPMCVAIILEW